MQAIKPLFLGPLVLRHRNSSDHHGHTQSERKPLDNLHTIEFNSTKKQLMLRHDSQDQAQAENWTIDKI